MWFKDSTSFLMKCCFFGLLDRNGSKDENRNSKIDESYVFLQVIIYGLIYNVVFFSSSRSLIPIFLILDIIMINCANFLSYFRPSGQKISCQFRPSIIIEILKAVFIVFIMNNFNDPKQHRSEMRILVNLSIKSQIVKDFSKNDIVWGVNHGCEGENIDQGRSYFDQSISISHCSFSRSLSYSGNGGVIYVSGGSFCLSVSHLMFYNCVCSSQGGAIYFDSTNSSLRMICAFRCSSYNSRFSFLKASLENQVEYISVSNCSHDPSGFYPIYLSLGIQRVDYTNSSMNSARYYSGIGINSPAAFTSSHCTFSNNKASDGICVYFEHNSGSMSSANIVHNNCPSSSHGVVHVFGAYIMSYCIFQGNQNLLFYIYSGSLSISNSFIDHSGFTSTGVNNSLTNTKTYQLQYFSSHYCNADIPIIKTELKTFDKTNTIPFSLKYQLLILMEL